MMQMSCWKGTCGSGTHVSDPSAQGRVDAAGAHATRFVCQEVVLMLAVTLPALQVAVGLVTVTAWEACVMSKHWDGTRLLYPCGDTHPT